MTSEAVVGLEFITEFSTGDEREAPLYHCSMEECREEQGDAETMKSHILSLRHKQSYVYSQTGSFLHTQTEGLPQDQSAGGQRGSQDDQKWKI